MADLLGHRKRNRTTGGRGQGAVSEERAVKDAKGDVKDAAAVRLGSHTGAFCRRVRLKLKYRGGGFSVGKIPSGTILYAQLWCNFSHCC